MLGGMPLNTLAGDESVRQLEDFFTLQGAGAEYLSPHGIGLNLSRYHWTGLPTDEYMLLPGYGIRGTIGQTNRLELLGKLSLGGFLGASTGPYFGEDGYGLAASAWYGAGLAGWETSCYWGDGGMKTEVGIYLAIQFGSKHDGEYQFRNFVVDILKL